MKIKTLDIYGYGKWVHQTFDLDQNLQIFYGPNEIGKSTLQSFIKSILFGFPDKRKRKHLQNRYEPRHSDIYGGRILIDHENLGEVWIERTSKFLTIQTKSGDILPDSTLDDILGGLDETLFDYFYGFNIQNLQDLSNVGSEDLNQFFLSIGTLGSDKFLEVAQQFEKYQDQLYKPKGVNPPLNQRLAAYRDTQEKIGRLKENNLRYDALLQHKQDEQATIANLEEKIHDLEQELRHSDQLISRYSSFLEDQRVLRELDRLEYTEMEADMPGKVNQALRDIHTSETQVAALKERVRQIEGDLTQLTRLSWARSHEDQRRQWKQDIETVKEKQTQSEQLFRQINESEEIMTHLALQGKFYPEKIKYGQEYEEQMEAGLTLQADLEQEHEHMDQLKSERKVLLDQRKHYQNQSAITRQHVAKLENQRVNEEERLLQLTKLSDYILACLCCLAGLGLGIFGWMQSKPITHWLILLAAGMVIIGIIAIGQIFFKHRQYIEAFQNNPIHEDIEHLKEDEGRFLEQSRGLGLEINQREADIQEIATKITEIEQAQKSWLVQLGFYPDANPEHVLKTNPAKHYFDAQERHFKYQAERSQLIQDLEDWRDSLKELFQRFPMDTDENNIRSIIRHVESTEATLVQSVMRAEALEERQVMTLQAIEEEQAKIEAYQALIDDILEKTASQNTLDFNHKVRVNEEIMGLRQSHQMYQDQISDYLEQLATIENKQVLDEQYHRQTQQLERLKMQLTPHMHQLANVMVEIDQLEQDGSYAQLSQVAEDLKAEVSQMMRQWVQKRIATQLIVETLKHGLENPVPDMNQRVNEIFTQLSGGRYVEVKFNKNHIKVRQFSDLLFEPHELSQGTLEQLYVALRLAFVESAKQRVTMPVIIDDAFVNFDEQRRHQMYQVLKDMSQNHQILFFTFDALAKEVFGDAAVMDLQEGSQTIDASQDTDGIVNS